MKLKHWIIIGIVVVVALAILTKNNVSKKLWNLWKKDLTQKEQISKATYDSLDAVRQSDYLKYIDAINMKDLEIEGIKNQLNAEKQKSYQYEKQLNTYRRGDFDERYDVFSKTYHPENDH